MSATRDVDEESLDDFTEDLVDAIYGLDEVEEGCISIEDLEFLHLLIVLLFLKVTNFQLMSKF